MELGRQPCQWEEPLRGKDQVGCGRELGQLDGWGCPDDEGVLVAGGDRMESQAKELAASDGHCTTADPEGGNMRDPGMNPELLLLTCFKF